MPKLYQLASKLVPGPVRKAVQRTVELANDTRFYCRALSGGSNYNISINSDLTVSCSCQDVDGAGRIGDLTQQSFEEIWRGEKAQGFRDTLAAGRMPIDVCRSCPELVAVPAEEAADHATRFTLPSKGLMVETTSACNLACTACDREAIASAWGRRQMSAADVDRVAEVVGALQVEEVHLFKYGDPFLSKRVKQEVARLRAARPGLRIVTSTNGMLLVGEDKVEAALAMDGVTFSIDGIDTASMARYQVGGDFDVAYANMVNLVRARAERGLDRPVIEWKYVLFRWNDSQEMVDRAIAMAKEAAVDRLSFWFTNSPRFDQSLRYRLGGYVATVGEPFFGGRVIDFRSGASAAPG